MSLKKRFKVKKLDSTNLMILFLSFSNLIANALNIISGLFVARWLLPNELGTFSSFTIFTGYIILVQLGIPSAISRELPFYLGTNDKDHAYKLTAVSQFWQKLLSLGVLIIGIIISLVFLYLGDYLYASGIAVVSLMSWQALYVTKYLKILYRTNKDFNKLSWIKLINGVSAFATIILVWQFGFYGLCLRAVINILIDFVVTYYWRPIKVKAYWDKISFISLIKLGLPMYGVASVYGLWPLIQRTLILSMGGTTALGLFSIATMVEAGMKTVSGSLSSVMYPTMTTQWGKGLKLNQIMKKLKKPFGLSFILLAAVIPVGWWLLPFFIELLLPNYIEGIVAAQWMLLVGLLSLANVFSNVYNIVKDQKNRLICYLSGFTVWAVSVFGLKLVNGFTLEIFPQAMIPALIIMALLNFLYINKKWNLNHNIND